MNNEFWYTSRITFANYGDVRVQAKGTITNNSKYLRVRGGKLLMHVCRCIKE